VDDLELRRPPPSYTIDTVRALRSRGWDEVHWLIGADQVATLPNWHESLSLLNEAMILIVQRPGYKIDWDKLPELYRRLQENVVEAPLLEISSSDIRRRVREGKPIAGLVADAVADYIHARGLYRSP
jgi:nicotinate-nucleotide adenylyltransferase